MIGRTGTGTAPAPGIQWPWSPLTVDSTERKALRRLAAGCGHTSVEYTVA
ncbi:hypothetical protein [Streptomyces chrestomyceticus]|uniref:Uncharacterized protein n=1 Tax=Streptomyces chrestomyceticus TaxID=68185 RepID=A0ABU7X6W5_9ACTN